MNIYLFKLTFPEKVDPSSFNDKFICKTLINGDDKSKNNLS